MRIRGEKIGDLLTWKLTEEHRRAMDDSNPIRGSEGQRHFDKMADRAENDRHRLADGSLPADYEPKDTTRTKIYAHTTLHGYIEQARAFERWLKAEGIPTRYKTAEEAKPRVAEYLKAMTEKYNETGRPRPQTIKTAQAALVKAFEMTREESEALPEIPAVHNGDVIRSRLEVATDLRIDKSSDRYKEIKNFCKVTGLRRSELEKLKPEQLKFDRDGRPYLEIVGKGGRYRETHFYGNQAEVAAAIDKIRSSPKETAIFGKVQHGVDIHHWRALYARRVYRKFARPIERLSPSEIYIHKIYDASGHYVGFVKYDRQALHRASLELGHNRESVVANSYASQGFFE
jgi:hypothetical protein